MPKVSVIVPVYNGRDYIVGCLQNVLKQTLKDIEIIFVDDGSNDDTLIMLNAYKCRHKLQNLFVVSQNNSGAGVARNTGLKIANGEFISFLDVDDSYADDMTLELLYNKANENGADICGGSLSNVEDRLPADNKRRFQTEGFVDFNDYQFDFGFQRYIYRLSFLRSNNIYFPSYRIYEDPVFLLEAMVKAQRFYAIKEDVYAYSGTHQRDLDAQKTIDYLHGLEDNLRLSAKFNYGTLHNLLFERLRSTASYYAEMNLDTADSRLYEALISVNFAIDKELLRGEGIDISEDYLIPALHTIWQACGKYFRLRKKLPFSGLIVFLKNKSWSRRKM